MISQSLVDTLLIECGRFKWCVGRFKNPLNFIANFFMSKSSGQKERKRGDQLFWNVYKVEPHVTFGRVIVKEPCKHI